MVLVGVTRTRQIVLGIPLANGIPEAAALPQSEALMAAESSGHPAHGTLRPRRMVERFHAGAPARGRPDGTNGPLPRCWRSMGGTDSVRWWPCR